MTTFAYSRGKSMVPRIVLYGTKEKKSIYVRFEFFMAVTMKSAVFWHINTNSYHTGDALRLRYRAQPDNAM
jgi:hypothetical protein